MRCGPGWSAGGLCLALCSCAGEPAAQSGGSLQPVAAIDAGRPAARALDAGRVNAHDFNSPAAAPVDMASADVDAGTTSGDAAEADAGADEEDTSCLDRVVNFDGQGPFEAHATTHELLKLWLPSLPTDCKAPVIQFANGTGAVCANYQALLERLASHGFLVVCAETPTTGSGVAGLRALETVLERYPVLAAHKLGSMGHEAGGQGAILAMQQAEAKWGAGASYAGLAIAPTSGHGAQGSTR